MTLCLIRVSISDLLDLKHSTETSITKVSKERTNDIAVKVPVAPKEPTTPGMCGL